MSVETAQTAPAYRPFAVEVARVRRLSPGFQRITFTGADLDGFAAAGADQRIKVLLPRSARDCPLGDDWYARWRALPTGSRPPMRTYTVRAARPHVREVDVDFVLHGATGPASAFAEAAAPGDEVVLVGPNARYGGPPSGLEWRPPRGAGPLLLAGDETAVPAIAAIAEALPPGTGARVLLEVPTDDDVLDLDVPGDVRLTWLPRRCGRTGHPRGALLGAAVRSAADGLGLTGGCPTGSTPEAADPDGELWDVPAEDGTASGAAGPYAWLAGEAGVVTGLRRHLLGEVGLDRRAVAFMGYWRQGRPAAG